MQYLNEFCKISLSLLFRYIGVELYLEMLRIRKLIMGGRLSNGTKSSGLIVNT